MYSSVTETEIDLMSKQGYCLRALARARMRRERVAFLATLAAALAVADAVVSSPPLIQALVDDDASRALELIAAGEDVSVLDIVTPLYAAQEYLRSHAQRRSVLRRLIESGAAVDQTTQDGTTTLMLAAYQGDARSAQLLLDAGADPTRRNDGGHSAVLAAEQGGHLELAEQLREHADERWVALAGLVERHVSEVHGGLRRLLSAACPAAEPARLPSPAEQRRGEASSVELFEFAPPTPPTPPGVAEEGCSLFGAAGLLESGAALEASDALRNDSAEEDVARVSSWRAEAGGAACCMEPRAQH